jgi:hypothetical protein
MKYYKAFAPILIALLVYGCEQKDLLKLRGYDVSVSKNRVLSVKDRDYQLFLWHPYTNDLNVRGFIMPIGDTNLNFIIDCETGKWNFSELKDAKTEGKVLYFDQYQAVTEISWFHDGEKFLTITPNALVSFSDSKKIKVDHILPPHIIVLQDSLSYYFTIEQKSCPIVISSCRSNHKIDNFKDDLISNTRKFSIKSDSLPITITIDYLIKYPKPAKSYQWNSTTDSVIELKIDQ